MSKPANTFIAVKNAHADNVSETDIDYASIADRLFEAYSETDKAVREIEATYQSSLASKKSALIESVKLIADEFPGMTGAEFDEHVKEPLTKAFTSAQYKAVPTRVSVLKVAFLAFANGVEPESDKAQRNIQHFVNEEARPALLRDGVIEQTGKGRKQGSTAKAPKDAMFEAALVLARHGDASLDGEVVKARAAKLKALATAGNWKLLDKLLDQGCKQARIAL